MDDERYADAIGEIVMTGSVVRMDLVSLSSTEKDGNGQPKPVFRQRIVMPVDGFIRSFGLMVQVMQQLEKQGVIKRSEIEGPAAAVPEPPKSKNFR